MSAFSLLEEIPPPIAKTSRTERFTIFLTPESANKLSRAASDRGEQPGRLASILVEMAASRFPDEPTEDPGSAA